MLLPFLLLLLLADLSSVCFADFLCFPVTALIREGCPEGTLRHGGNCWSFVEVRSDLVGDGSDHVCLLPDDNFEVLRDLSLEPAEVRCTPGPLFYSARCNLFLQAISECLSYRTVNNKDKLGDSQIEALNVSTTGYLQPSDSVTSTLPKTDTVLYPGRPSCSQLRPGAGLDLTKSTRLCSSSSGECMDLLFALDAPANGVCPQNYYHLRGRCFVKESTPLVKIFVYQDDKLSIFDPPVRICRMNNVHRMAKCRPLTIIGATSTRRPG